METVYHLSHNLLFANLVYRSDLVLLSSTSSSETVGTTTATWTAGATYLRVVIITSGQTGGIVRVKFNNDSGGNYGFKVTPDDTTASAVSGSSAEAIDLHVNGVTVGTFFVLDIKNIAGQRKLVDIRGNEGASGAGAPVKIDGSGAWNNTSDRITRVDVVASGSNTFNTSPVTIYVYGTRD